MINYDSWGLCFNMLIGSLGALGLDFGLEAQAQSQSQSQSSVSVLSLRFDFCVPLSLRHRATKPSKLNPSRFSSLHGAMRS